MTRNERNQAVALEANRWDDNPKFWLNCERVMWPGFKRAQIASKLVDARLLALGAWYAAKPAGKVLSSCG